MPRMAFALTAILMMASSPWSAIAKDFKLGTDPVAATITLPDSWGGDLADGQVETLSPDKAIYFSAETVSSADLKAVGQEVAQQLAEQKIELKQDSRKVAPVTIAGMPGAAISWDAKDTDGPIQVRMLALKARPDTEILVLHWGDEAAEKDHAAEIDAIVNSLKPVK